MTRDEFQRAAGDWFCWIAAPMLTIYGVGLLALPSLGYTWHPYVTLAQAFVAPIAAAIKKGYFWGDK